MVDDGGFAALYRAHFDFVYRTLRRLGVPPSLVDDAAQEVFLVVLRRRDEVAIASTRGWIFGVTRRIAWRVRRSGARHRRLTQALAESPPWAVDGPTAVAEREASALLGRFLDRLDDDKRAVFLLAELEQMTAPEISRALGIKENTVYSRLRAARQDFDRSFARLRRSERRATGDAAGDERALLLSRARRADRPRDEDRRRVWTPSAAPRGRSAATRGGSSPLEDLAGEPLDLGGDPTAALARPEAIVGAHLGAHLGAHIVWGIAVALVGVLAVAGGRSLAGSSAAGGGLQGHAQSDMSDGTVDTSASSDPVVGPAVDRLAEGDPRGAPRSSAAPTPADVPAAPGASPRPSSSRAADATARAAASATEGDAPGPKTAASLDRSRPGGGAPFQPVSKDLSDPPGEDAPAALDPADLAREAALLTRAREALRVGDFAGARDLLDRHAREFPAGALVDERRLSRIAALCGLGEASAARAEVAHAEAERPGSTFARRAAALCPMAVSSTSHN
ncbi:MAG: sigma-70 family RNA polymerase sigma factor [Nannocystaceae bacterium]